MMLPRSKDAAAFLEVLLKSGADIHVRDKKGRTALMRACPGHQFEVMNKLIGLGLDPHESDESGYKPCEPRLKPLSFAPTFDERNSCEGSPTDEVVALAKAIRRLGHELKDLNLTFDENALGIIAADDGLRYLVGPYYGWAGGGRRCKTLIRMAKTPEGRWMVEGKSLQKNPDKVYGIVVTGDDSLSVRIEKGIVDAMDGKSTSWNSYPISGSDGKTWCYRASVIKPNNDNSPSGFSLVVPEKVPCPENIRTKSK